MAWQANALTELEPEAVDMVRQRLHSVREVRRVGDLAQQHAASTPSAHGQRAASARAAHGQRAGSTRPARSQHAEDTVGVRSAHAWRTWRASGSSHGRVRLVSCQQSSMLMKE